MDELLQKKDDMLSQITQKRFLGPGRGRKGVREGEG